MRLASTPPAGARGEEVTDFQLDEPEGSVWPNPGSREAIAGGCTCAVLDNRHGQGLPGAPPLFWITAGCPLHADGWAHEVRVNVGPELPGGKA